MIEYFAAIFFAAGVAPLGAPDAGTPPPVSPATFKHPVQIDADKLEIQGKKNQAIWAGHVKAVRGGTRLSCDRLIAHFTPAQEITRLECLGGVEVLDGDRWAKGERAEFDNVAGLLVVTGSPEMRQGPNHMRGTKVTFHVESDVVEVESPKVVFETAPRGGVPVPAAPKKKGKGP